MGCALTVEALLDRAIARPSGCLEWLGKIKGDGYAVATIDGREVKVARLVWRLIHGELDDALNICHACDNPPCIRPDHLFVGTQADNMADMAAKGRAANRATRYPVTQCVRGHAFDEANTAIDGRGNRRCRACSRLRSKGLLRNLVA